MSRTTSIWMLLVAVCAGVLLIIPEATGAQVYAEGEGQSAPANDDWGFATGIGEGLPAVGSTAGATGTDISSCGLNDTADVWFIYFPTSEGTATISLCGSSFDTTLAVFAGFEPGFPLACNDDFCGLRSQITLPVLYGCVCLLRVAGFNGATGEYNLLVTVDGDEGEGEGEGMMAEGESEGEGEGEGEGINVTYRFDRMWPMLQQPWYFYWPTSVAVSPDGSVYIADSRNGRIQKFTEDGAMVTKWGSTGYGDGQFIYPEGLGLGSDGSVYVADMYGSRIQKFTADGVFVTKWGSGGAGEGQFQYPPGVGVGPDGSVYVSDPYNSRIQKFTADGVWLTQWGSAGTGDSQFDQPCGVAVDIYGFVYVADTQNNRIQKFTADGVFVTRWGNKGSNSGQFSEPRGVMVDTGGSVYVADSNNARIQKFTLYGDFLDQWGIAGSGDAQFDWPFGVGKGPDGSIYVADTNNNRIQKFNFYGTFLSQWGNAASKDGTFNDPWGVEMGSDGLLYVADKNNNRIEKFSEDGTFVGQWGSHGHGDAQFDLPSDVAVGPDGSIYVADNNNYRIQKFTSDGVFMDKWGTAGYGDGQFLSPEGVAVDLNGFVYVLDRGNNRIQKFTSDGSYVTQWGSVGTGDGQFDYNFYGVAVDSDGFVYVADTYNWRIQKFTSDGTFVAKWGVPGSADGQFNRPCGITIGPNGYVFVADTWNHRIQAFTSDGTFVTQWGAAGQFSFPRDVAVGPDGSVYVADTSNNRIQKFYPVVLTQNSKVVVVAGGGPYPGNNLWDATRICANFAYRTLTYQGFTKQDIYYLSSDTALDLDDNGLVDDVDGDCTLENLQYGLIQWVPEQTNGLPTGNVVLYLVDHGGDGMFRMSATETLSVNDLVSWLNSLQSGIQGTLTVIYDACESGSFVQALTAPAEYASKRIVMASTAAGEPAYFVTQGSVSFSNFFWTHVFNGLDLYSAFTLTTESLGLSVDQTPLLEADGDGVPNQTADFQAIQNKYIGNGTTLNSAAPVIGSVSPPQSLTATSTAVLYAEGVTDEDGIARVWAIIRPPDFVPPLTGNPVQSLPQVKLEPTDTPGRYEGAFNGFTTQGIYHIAIYARDRSLNTSIPKVTTVSVDSPLRRRAVIVAGGSASDPTWNAVERGVVGAFRALSYQGYTVDDIYFLCPLGIEGVDGLPMLSNIEYALTDWVGANTQDLVVYFIGNGGSETFLLNDTEALSADVLDSWLDTLQSTLPGVLTVVYDACRSGSFVPWLTPPTEESRIVITSSDPFEASVQDANGVASFSSYFWSRILNGASVANAFSGARQAMKTGGIGPDAQLDDNGNGLANEKTDGILARNYTLGAGVMLAGDDPVIGDIVPEQSLSGNPNAILWVDQVTTTGTIAQVWALITPPSFTLQGLCAGDFTLPVLDLIPLGWGRYEATYDGFTQLGRYHVAIYAMDANGSLSLPAETDVVQNLVAGIPDSYEPDNMKEEASWIGINGPNQTHTLHVANDEDWARFYGKVGQEVTLETLDLGVDCDTYLEVYRGEETTPLATNDDENPGILSSYIRFTVTEEGMYYARVRYSPATPFPSGATFDTQYTLAVWEEQGILSATLLCGVTTPDSEPILNASVHLDPLSLTVTQNVNGIYSFLVLPSGVNYTVRVEAPEYVMWTGWVLLYPGENKTLSIVLEPVEEDEGEGVIEGQTEGSIEGSQEGAVEGEGSMEGQSEGQAEGEGRVEGALEGEFQEGEVLVYTADQNGDGRISLSELLRVIQFFNSDAIHCDPSTEDGYAPGIGDSSCIPYTTDYNPQDWHISLSELLRVIQFYNSDGYHACEESEDGYCPDP